jgi:hypothetical protein
MSAKRNTALKGPADIALVVFGTKGRQSHASRFGVEAAQSAQEAARAMGMATLRITSPAQLAVARRLPKGTVSAKGRTSLPLVAPALYNKLLAIAGTDSPPPTPPSQPATEPGKKPPIANDAKRDEFGGWTGLQKNAVVLATESPDEGWWEATVVHVNDTILTLRWRDYPSLPQFQRTLTQVALLHPKMVKPC